jgi:hypothetical protein
MRGIAFRITLGSLLLLVGGCSRAAPPVATVAPPAPAPGSASSAPASAAPVAAAPPAPAALAPPPGYFVVAHGRSTRGTWFFDVQQLEGRTLVSACLAGVTNGCVEPRVREVTRSGWVETPELLRGLPELGLVNLRQDPNSPWHRVGHKSDSAREQDRCLSQPFFSGVRSLEIVGEWPGNTWAVVDELGEEWAMRTCVLYRWQEGRFTEVHRTGRVADFFEGVVPWQEGLAVLEIQLVSPTPDKVRVVAFSGQAKRVLTEIPNDSLSSASLARLGPALVLSGVRDDGTVELFAWTAPGAAQRHRLRSNHTYSGVTFSGARGTVFFHAADEAYEAVEVAFEGKWREVGRRSLDEAELEALTGANKERLFSPALGFSVERAATRQGQSWLFLRRTEPDGARGFESWLLSEQAPPGVWELPDEPARELARPPDRPGCQSRSGP